MFLILLTTSHDLHWCCFSLTSTKHSLTLKYFVEKFKEKHTNLYLLFIVVTEKNLKIKNLRIFVYKIAILRISLQKNRVVK